MDRPAALLSFGPLAARAKARSAGGFCRFCGNDSGNRSNPLLSGKIRCSLSKCRVAAHEFYGGTLPRRDDHEQLDFPERRHSENIAAGRSWTPPRMLFFECGYRRGCQNKRYGRIDGDFVPFGPVRFWGIRNICLCQSL